MERLLGPGYDSEHPEVQAIEKLTDLKDIRDFLKAYGVASDSLSLWQGTVQKLEYLRDQGRCAAGTEWLRALEEIKPAA